MSRGSVRCRWRDDVPDPLPGPATTHFQTAAGVRQLHAQRDVPRVAVAHDESGRRLATWVLALTGSDPFIRPRSRVAQVADRHLTASYGPVIDPALAPPKRDAVRRALLRAVRRRTERTRPISCSLALDPILGDDERSAWGAAAREVGFEVAERHTWYAELSADLDVLASVRRDRRKAVRKGGEMGLEFVEHDSIDGLCKYSEVRHETRVRNGHDPIPWAHWERTWAAFEDTGVMHVFTVSQGDRLGAAQLAFACGDYVYLVGVSIAEWARAERVPANEYLQLNVLKWAQDGGRRIVDFVGANPGTEDPKLKAIDQFKSSWGSKLGTSLTLSLSGSRLRQKAANLARRLPG